MTPVAIYRVLVLAIGLGFIVYGLTCIADEILHHQIHAPELTRHQLSLGLSAVSSGLLATAFSRQIAQATAKITGANSRCAIPFV